MLQQGFILGNRYKIISLIGTGGMADVYKATDKRLNRPVAIKILKKEYYNNEPFLKRFVTEAEASAVLTHPNIVRTYDAAYSEGYHYIVMELAAGTSLKEYIKEKEVLTPREAIKIAIQIADGLSEAHAEKIIHRDIKPENIIISASGKIKIMDFGIAKVANGGTITGDTMGSVHYMSPEQAKGRYSDCKTDIYSLGITLYEMVTGELPFDGDNNVAIALMHVKEPFPSARKVNPSVPKSLDKIIQKCTMKRPGERYQTDEELMGDLKKELARKRGYNVSFSNSTKVKATQKRRKKQSLIENISDFVRDIIPTSRSKRLIATLSSLTLFVIMVVLLSITTKSDVSVPIAIQNKEITQKDANDKRTKTPNFIGSHKDEAEKTLKRKDLKGEFNYDDGYSDKDSGLIVVSQYPSPGDAIEEGEIVSLILGMNEDDYIDIPDVVGHKKDEAVKLIKKKNLKVRESYNTSDIITEGCIMAQSPKPGTTVSKDFVVTIVISKGVEEVRVPSLHGMSQENAIRELERVGLRVGNIKSDYSGDVGINDVITQSIEAGSYVQKGTKITITVSIGEPVN